MYRNLSHADGQLRHIETGEPFLFEVKKGDKAYNQAHYEALGEVRYPSFPGFLASIHAIE